MSDIFSGLDLSKIGAADTFDARDLFGDSGGGGFFSNLSNVSLPDFTAGLFDTPLIAPVENLPSTGAGVSGMFRDLTGLINVAFQGQAMVEQQKLLNKIGAAKLQNQLSTVRTTPNIWLVLGVAGAGFFALEMMNSRRDRG